MSKIVNAEGRVFGCLSAAEQQELKDAAKVPGAVVSVPFNPGFDELGWLPIECAPVWQPSSAYRVTLPAAPVTCPVCGSPLFKQVGSSHYHCTNDYNHWYQTDAVQRPKRPEPREGYHYEWRLAKFGEECYDGIMWMKAHIDFVNNRMWIAVPDADPLAREIATEEFLNDSGRDEPAPPPAPEPVPANLCDSCAKNMHGCIPSPSPHYACGFYAQKVPEPEKPVILCGSCRTNCSGVSGGVTECHAYEPEPVPVVPVVEYLADMGRIYLYRIVDGRCDEVVDTRNHHVAIQAGWIFTGTSCLKITESEYAAAKSPDHIRGVTKVIEPLGNFPDMALMREKVNELVEWISAKGGG